MTWITPARSSDYAELAQLMYHTVRIGARAYTVPERAVWMAKIPDGRRWRARLDAMDVYVARSPRGFVAMTRMGYVDFAYVSPTAQRRGVFRGLLGVLQSAHPGLPMTTHASLHAQPAFTAIGFTAVHHEIVRRQGQRLKRAFMARA